MYGDQDWPDVNDSITSKVTAPATAAACHQRTLGSSNPTRPAPAITPHVAGGWSKNDRTENSAIPAMLPKMRGSPGSVDTLI